MDVADTLPGHNAGLEALLTKLQPLLDSGRMDNVVDVLALVSDLVDMLDGAMVEKLALLFEQATAVSWNVGNAARMATAQTQAEETPPSLYGLLSLLREPDTRRGVALVLRTLNVLGRQL
ncbi:MULTISPECIES: DUF1641 domain-containing protein [Pseudomonas]|uniref:DUF1641 domain-containing protein n=1 Tax=Pseudomonas synxantha TaxID=47883 RepID=A0AAX3I0W4_9PSED|nr:MULTISPECIES: DUF1641 domain-containing protein [Pseudomonas]AZE64789.1 hypothetical protein C4K01_0563 [Pseudomonas synxantha]KRA10165.1 hypothetical protein ASD70_07685 [Pseudomonas sp. Root569]KRP54236.1 hypothetical protein TU77_14500 [Pseudomonas synxantha]MBI6564206.1 DUF1641 domain-containing protein [Pseudomonas synxantha]MBI6578753.1 DUF1641 domain-containing protein [Pseudomonas synxantha]